MYTGQRGSGRRGYPGTEDRRVEPLVDGSPSPYTKYGSPPRAPFSRPDIGYTTGGLSGQRSPLATGLGLGGGSMPGGSYYSGSLGSGLGGYSTGPPAAYMSPRMSPHVGPISPTRAYARPNKGVFDGPRSTGIRSRSSRKPQTIGDAAPDSSALLQTGGVSRGVSSRTAVYSGSPGRGGTMYDDAPPTQSMDMDELDAGGRMVPEGGLVTRDTADEDPRRSAYTTATVKQPAWATWVVVFGFPRDLQHSVIDQFKLYGQVQDQLVGQTSNWVMLRYATRQQADKATAQNGTLLRTGLPQDQILIGVSRLRAENARTLGVMMSAQSGEPVLSRREERVGSYTLPPSRDFPATLRRPGAGLDDEPRRGRSYNINDRDLLKAPTRRRNLLQVLWEVVMKLFNWT